MLYAIRDNEKVKAQPKLKAECSCCETEVIAKCGRIMTWHWSHKSKVNCDSWKENESQWHLEWKSIFPKDRTEIRQVINGEPHFADVMLYDGHVIEFQKSSISVDEIEQREKAYRTMSWVFDARHCIDRIYFRDKGDYYTFRWLYPRKVLSFCVKPVYLDLGDKSIFELKKIDTEAPCGGWGRIINRDAFIRRMSINHAERKGRK